MHRDPLIDQVLETWMSRFLNGEVPYADIQRTVARMDTWNAWGPEWMKTAAMHEALATQAWDAGRRFSAVQAFQIAAACYHMAFFIYTRDPELHARGLHKMLECHDRALPYMEPRVEKVSIPFEQIHLVGLFSRPKTDAPPPAVILIPGLDSTKETRHRGRGGFLKRSMAVLSLDGPGQGEMSESTIIRADYEKAIGAAIDYLESRGDVDTTRIGLNGASLGGYYAPRAAAFEPRVKAAVANCGPYDFAECFDILPQVTREAFQLYSGAHTMEEARERAGALSLKGVAERITCPLLVLHGKLDPLIPWEQGKRIVDEACGPKEFVLFDEGTHGLNNIPYKSGPLAADWLAERLGGKIA